MNTRIGFATKASLLSATACVILCPTIALIAQPNAALRPKSINSEHQRSLLIQSAVERNLQELHERSQPKEVSSLNDVSTPEEATAINAAYFADSQIGEIVQTQGIRSATPLMSAAAIAQAPSQGSSAPLRFTPPSFARRLIDKITGHPSTKNKGVIQRPGITPAVPQQGQQATSQLTPQPEPNLGAAQPESEITRQLKMLYAQDGKEMPPMSFSALPDTAEGAQQQKQQRDMTKRSGHAVSSPSNPIEYVKSLLPFGRSSTPTTRKSVAGSQPQPTPAMPQVRRLRPTQQTAGIESDLAPLPPKVSPRNIEPAVAPESPRLLSDSEETSAKEPERVATSEPSLLETAVKETAATSPLADDLGNPFTETSEAEADQAQNPFTGLKLEEQTAKANPELTEQETPAEPLPTVTPKTEIVAERELPKIRPNTIDTPEKQEVADEEETAEANDNRPDARLERIAEREGKTGLKGFCIVALRNRGQLVDGKAELSSTFEGRTYTFSSEEAKKEFDGDPKRFALAARGSDVILLAAENQNVDGSLDHALWFRGKLYLFGSRQTMELFQLSPADYAVDAE